jgi:hypothetical protein
MKISSRKLGSLLRDKHGKNAFIDAIPTMLLFGFILMGAIVGAIWIGAPMLAESIGGNDDSSPISPQGTNPNQVESGKAAILGFSAFTGEWGLAGAKTEVYPTLTGKDDKGATLINDATANSTSTSTGRTISLWETGASYFFEPVTCVVNEETDTCDDIQTYARPATSNINITVYDSNTCGTVMTQDDNGNNTGDYAIAMGAGENKQVCAKISNAVADKTLFLAAIYTYYCGDEVEDVTLSDSDWVSVSIPSGNMQKTWLAYDDSNETASCSIKHVYVPSAGAYKKMNEWGEIYVKPVLSSDDSTAPTANGDSYVGWGIMDYGCESDNSGVVHCDFYKHDTSASSDDVGFDENAVTTGNRGGNTGVEIELQ